MIPEAPNSLISNLNEFHLRCGAIDFQVASIEKEIFAGSGIYDAKIVDSTTIETLSANFKDLSFSVQINGPKTQGPH